MVIIQYIKSQKLYKLDHQNIINYTRYKSFYYTDHIGNCKLCSLDSIGGIISSTINDEDLELLISSIVNSGSKACFKVSLTNINNIERLAKLFDIAYVNKINLGYDKYQYHACFINNIGDRARAYRNKIKNDIKLSSDELTKKLVKIRNNYLQKGSITDNDLEKIMNYKSKHFLKKFLAKKMAV